MRLFFSARHCRVTLCKVRTELTPQKSKSAHLKFNLSPIVAALCRSLWQALARGEAVEELAAAGDPEPEPVRSPTWRQDFRFRFKEP